MFAAYSQCRRDSDSIPMEVSVSWSQWDRQRQSVPGCCLLRQAASRRRLRYGKDRCRGQCRSSVGLSHWMMRQWLRQVIDDGCVIELCTTLTWSRAFAISGRNMFPPPHFARYVALLWHRSNTSCRMYYAAHRNSGWRCVPKWLVVIITMRRFALHNLK